MLLVKSSFPVLLSLGLVSQLCAQGPGDWWLQDNDVEPAERALDEGGVPDEEWLRDNDVEPFPPRAADGRVALKALVKALFRFKHLQAASESATKYKDSPEQTKTSTEYEFLAVPETKAVDSLPSPPAHHPMMENDKSHRFTHSIRFGYGAPHHGSLL